MRIDLRKTGAWFAIVSLIFWCSCERHHVGELPDQNASVETKAPAQDHEIKSSDQPAATEHHHQMAPTPAARNSPANFFPDKPKP